MPFAIMHQNDILTENTKTDTLIKMFHELEVSRM